MMRQSWCDRRLVRREEDYSFSVPETLMFYACDLFTNHTQVVELRDYYHILNTVTVSEDTQSHMNLKNMCTFLGLSGPGGPGG